MHAIAVHGGAGKLSADDLTPEGAGAFRRGLESALIAGFAILDSGGSALDAVVAAVRELEDNPLFNAGRGAVLSASGQHELDASLMDGRDLRAGAVAGVRHVRSPIELARLVMERSPHVMLASTGAEEFALEQGIAQRRAVFLERNEADIAVLHVKAEIMAGIGRLQHGKRG